LKRVILEGMITTVNEDGTANIAPLGPHVNRQLSQFTLKPFQSSRTYANLKRSGEAVFHITDNVEMMALAVTGNLPPAEVESAGCVNGFILKDACRWMALRAHTRDDTPPRATYQCSVVGSGRLRDFFGLNRAMHAVVEGAILATRLHMLPEKEVQQQFNSLAVLVEKTAGDRERNAFAALQQYVADFYQ